MNIKKKNILIIGVSSFVGYNLYKGFKSDFNIYGTFCNNRPYNAKNFYKINLINHLPFKVFNKVNFDYVIWCIQKNSGQQTFKSFYEINILGLLKLMNFLREKKITKLIFFSTGSIYEAGNKKITEDSSVNLKNNYTITKYFGELICEVFSKLYKFNLIILRPFTIYGVDQKDKLIFNLIKKIKKNKNIYIDGKEGVKLSCIHILDLVKVVKYLIVKYDKEYLRLNITSNFFYSIKKFCLIISKKIKKKPSLISNDKENFNMISKQDKILKKFNFISFEKFVEKNL